MALQNRASKSKSHMTKSNYFLIINVAHAGLKTESFLYWIATKRETDQRSDSLSRYAKELSSERA